ncbi:chromosomal replication initiator protein DnaA [Alsobacter sp. R-9]
MTDIGSLEQQRADRDQAFERVLRRLRAELGDDVFSSWFGRLELVGVSDGVAHLTVPTRFLKSWIQSHYLDKVRSLASAEIEGVRDITLGFRGAMTRAHARTAAEPPAVAQGAGAVNGRHPVAERPAAVMAVPVADRTPATELDGIQGSPLDRRLTFSSFLVGKSNALAHAAAERVARIEAGAAPLYNPLYIHSAVGLGKTHLLQAVAHEVLAANRRVIYLTADRFMYGFVAALKAQTALAFKERLRGIDLLVIDDVQFLQGKSIQQEFCHTINALIDAGRQVVIAADRPPGDLESLDERVRSRLAGGLVVEMGALDEALRVKILEARIAAARVHQPGFDVNAQVLTYVARAITTNGRDLDGAVNRLLAHTTLTGAALTVEIAETAIRDLVRSREPRKVRIEDIQKLVATHYNVSRADILSSRRSAGVVKPRQIAMYLSKQLTLRSLPEIGRRFGGRDHTTVLHAVRKIENAVGADPTLREDIELLKRMLQE